ncbi:MAG: alpha/beta fold hydrolase [Rhodobacteraceae bacterium]|nr:alpha/beta fold hydrolase [Paracoccaceae bacterium]
MKDRSAAPPHKLQADVELLQTIYETALLPNNYDDLIDTWSARLEAVLDDASDSMLHGGDETLPVDLSDSIRFLDTSLQLFERLDTARRLESSTREAERSSFPKLVLDATGKVVWYNGAALRRFGLTRQSTQASLDMDDGARRRLGAEIAALGDAAAGRMAGNGSPGASGGRPPLVILLRARDGSGPVFMVGRAVAQADHPDILVLDQADTGWNDAIEAVLKGSFGLSATEIDIVAQLADGLSLAQIADRRGRQLSTLRTQLKSVLRKTQTHSQAQLVRLALSLASHIDASTARLAETRAPFQVHTLPDGRSLHYRDTGPEDGAPVMFLHGMLDGLSFGKAFTAELWTRGIRIVAPERPFFGAAPGTAWPVPDVPDLLAADLAHLIATLDLRDLRLIGHMAGSVYSFTLARHAPERVAGIVNVAGGVPITALAQFRHMSPRQRTVAYTARFTPSALPLILHAGVRQIEAGGVDRFVRALYAKSPIDLAAFGTPEIGGTIADGVKFAVAQGYRAFEIDSYHVVRDWSHRARASTCPVVLLHGRHDPVVSAASVEAFGRALGHRARVMIAEDAGQTVLFTHPAQVFEALSRL